MAGFCGPPPLATDRQREDKPSNWAESLVVLGDRPLSERGQTFAEIVVSELKKLSEGQATLARDLDAQHQEVIQRLDRQYGPMASEASGTWRPAAQPLATDHKEPPGFSISAEGQSKDVDTRDDREELQAGDDSAKDVPDAIQFAKKESTMYPLRSMTSPVWEKVGDSQGIIRNVHKPGRLEIFLGGYGELIMGVVIVVNMIVLCAELQIMGETKLAYDIGILDTQGNWEDQEARFANVEFVFTIVYTLELLVNLKVVGLAYMKECFNIVDSMVVLVAALQSFILRPLTPGDVQSEFSVVFARILKLARIIRVAKILKVMNTFVELRILLQTIWSSRSILMWDIILITANVVGTGIVIFQMTSLWIQDDSVPDETRVWLYDHFGTWARASYTMFEATFSTAWTSKAYYMVTEISGLYAVFWMVHVVFVNFALIRIVAALFLKQTMQVAAVDAEQTALRELKTKEQYAGILSSIFSKADTSGDGAINAEEFAVMMVDPNVSDMFQKMELTLDEVKMLFSVLVEEDGEADYDEFLSAALKMKNSCKGIDAVQILHQIAQVKKMVRNVACQGQIVSDGLDRMDARLSTMDHMVSRLQARGEARSCWSFAADPVSAIAKMEATSSVRAV